MVQLVENEKILANTGTSTDIKGEVGNLVKTLYTEQMSNNKWKTLAQFLDIFTEAVPYTVMEIIEENISKNNSEFWELFKPAKDILFGRNFYTHVLWSLEKLCQIPELTVRAIYALVRIMEKHFNYKLSNSPVESLFKVFCLWYPQGAISQENKIALIKIFLRDFHKSAVIIINKIIYEDGSKTTTSDLARFQWHYQEKLECPVDAEKAQLDIANVFIDNMQPELEDWHTVINHICYFANNVEDFEDKIILKADYLPKDDALEVYYIVGNCISRKKKYGHYTSLNGIRVLEKLYLALQIDAPEKYAHYFSHTFYGLDPTPYSNEKYNFQAEEEYLMSVRVEAINDIIDQWGLTGVLKLSHIVEDKKC